MQPPTFSLGLTSIPRTVVESYEGQRDEAPAGLGNHSKTAVSRQKVVGLDKLQLIRGWHFSEVASTRSRRHWWGRRLARSGEPRLYGGPEWLAMWDHGTARCACPAALVDTFAHWAAPDRAHGKVRSVSFRTSFPTRRPGLRGSVAGGRGAAVRRPLATKRRCWARWALILWCQLQRHQGGMYVADRGALGGVRRQHRINQVGQLSGNPMAGDAQRLTASDRHRRLVVPGHVEGWWRTGEVLGIDQTQGKHVRRHAEFRCSHPCVLDVAEQLR